MTSSLTRASITGLPNPRRSVDSSSSVAFNRLLNADKSGFLPLNTSSPQIPLLSSPEDIQLKRVRSKNEVLEQTIKRIRTESDHSIAELREKNESLERSLEQLNQKLIDSEEKLRVLERQSTRESILILEEKIKSLENEKLELKLKAEQLEMIHSKEITALEQKIQTVKHQLTDAENRLELLRIDRDQLEKVEENHRSELNEKHEQITQLENRITDLELRLSTAHYSETFHQSLIEDVKHLNDLRFENSQLKEEIELLKLKSKERLVSEEELRMLRQQVKINDEYRLLIVKQDAELNKLRDQLGMSKRSE